MKYIFDDWKQLLENFQNSVERDLEEIHKQKAAVQQIKVDIFNKLDAGLYYRDNDKIVISAPEIIIGNVDKSGALMNEKGKVIIKGIEVALDGVGENGHIVSRAPSIRQLAVNPGIDGMESVVCDTSEIVSQAGGIVLHSSASKKAFSQSAAAVDRGGVTIHADKGMKLEAAISAEERKTSIENTIRTLTTKHDELQAQIEKQKKSIDKFFDQMTNLLDKENESNTSVNFLGRLDLVKIEAYHEQMNDLLPTLYQATQSFIHLLSELAEVNRKKEVLNEEKNLIKTGDEFKNEATGAKLSVVAETIDVATKDGDGNIRTNADAGISITTPRCSVNAIDASGKLVENGAFAVNAQNISLSSKLVSGDDKELSAIGNVNISAKNINLESLDYQFDDHHRAVEKSLTGEGKITMTAKTVEVSTAGPKDIKRDENGKLTGGEYTGEGDVIIKSKTISMESLDYEVADGSLKTKALTKDSKIAVRSEKMDFLAADAEGKATGSISMNAKDIAVKSMDVDKEQLTDSGLAADSTMLLLSEKMLVGAKDKDTKSKKMQASAEEMELVAVKNLEAQQGDGKAKIKLADDNADIRGTKTEISGTTTIYDDTEFKSSLKTPKAEVDSLKVNTSFKSPNMNDGI